MTALIREPSTRIRHYFQAQKAFALAYMERGDAGEIADRLYGIGSGASLIARGLHTPSRNEFLRGDVDANMLRKAGVAGNVVTGSEFEGTDPTSIQVFDSVLEAAIIGRLRGLARVPFNTKFIGATADPDAHFIGEGEAFKMSRAQLTGSSLSTKKVVAGTVMTKELLQASGTLAENMFETKLRRATAYRADRMFIDPSNGGDERTPAAVTFGAPTWASTGDIRADLAGLTEHFAGDYLTSALIMHPQSAMQIALVTDSSGSLLFPDLGPGGGTLAGLPVLTSRAVPQDTSGGAIVLLDASGIALAQEGGRVLATDEGFVELDDDPQGDALAPTPASATLLSLFQTENIGFRVSVRVNWERQRPGCVSVITGATYA